MRVSRFSVGNGGWAEVHLTGRGEKPFTLVRFGRTDGDDELRVVEVYVAGAVTNSVLRFLDTTRLETIVNVTIPEFGRSIRQWLDVVSPDVRGTAAWYKSTGRNMPAAVPPPYRHGRGVTNGRVLITPDARIAVPEGPRLGPGFYRQLGKVWRRLDAAGVRDKNERIAEANNVDTRRVASWIKRARKSGYVPTAAGKGSRS